MNLPLEDARRKGVRVNIPVTRTMLDRLDAKAAQEGRTRADMARRLLELSLASPA